MKKPLGMRLVLALSWFGHGCAAIGIVAAVVAGILAMRGCCS